MRLLKVALVALVIVVLGWFATAPTKPAQASDPCTISVSGTTATVQCVGVGVVGTVPLPTVHVTLPPPPPVTDIIKLPGPTVRVPVPGPTTTVTTPSLPRATRTFTPPTKTVTVQPSSLPQPTVLQPEIGTGQPEPQRATIGPATPMYVPKDHYIPLVIGKVKVRDAALGVLATLAIVGLLLLGMYAGYILGYKTSEKKDTNFLRAVLDAAHTAK